MSDTVKLIVTLSKGQYEALKDIHFGGIGSKIIFNAVRNGIPLDSDNKGEWIATENEEMEVDGYFCSKCDLPMPTDEKTPFCPFCGADMRGDKSE